MERGEHENDPIAQHTHRRARKHRQNWSASHVGRGIVCRRERQLRERERRKSKASAWRKPDVRARQARARDACAAVGEPRSSTRLPCGPDVAPFRPTDRRKVRRGRLRFLAPRAKKRKKKKKQAARQAANDASPRTPQSSSRSAFLSTSRETTKRLCHLKRRGHCHSMRTANQANIHPSSHNTQAPALYV